MGSSTFLLVLFFPFLLLTLSHAATFDIVNRCPYTVWAAAIPGGGRQLDKNQTWTLTINPGNTSARFWPRTNCSFDSSGHGHCQTGDCGGLLACQADGSPPETIAEYATFVNKDFFDISVVDGFNVPMEIGPDSGSCPGGRPSRCSADLVELCPKELKVPGGCNSPCNVFKTNEYCCNDGTCTPNEYFNFFRSNCPDAYSGPNDDQESTFTCPQGTNYTVVFCP
ncbi:Thaumatin-like protein [Cocos nucifera]|uniref:Thaumatin-like protein n=1 Tax=Cocos nucifera TaxID=13894 RepID=A0A8K0N3I5_COCNU|nr:Thaumatin-like protein [Cocos nucifera]